MLSTLLWDESEKEQSEKEAYEKHEEHEEQEEDGFDKLLRVIAQISLEKAEGASADRDQIMKVAQSLGLNTLNGLVCASLRTWLADVATKALQDGWETENYGKDESRFLRLVDRVATLLQVQGDFNAAGAHFQRGIQRAKQTVGDQHFMYVTLISNFALLLQHVGQHEHAVPLFLEAIAMATNAT